MNFIFTQKELAYLDDIIKHDDDKEEIKKEKKYNINKINTNNLNKMRKNSIQVSFNSFFC
jgi:hypothetical protein